MHFTAATVAVFAGLAAAMPGNVETVYRTEDVTITSCEPTVTDCPASSSVPAGAGAASSSTPTSIPAIPTSSGGVIPGASSSSVPVNPSISIGNTPSYPAPTSSVVPVTTCIPTVTYSTVHPSPTAPTGGATSSVPVIPSAPIVGPSGTPSPSGSAS